MIENFFADENSNFNNQSDVNTKSSKRTDVSFILRPRSQWNSSVVFIEVKLNKYLQLKLGLAKHINTTKQLDNH